MQHWMGAMKRLVSYRDELEAVLADDLARLAGQAARPLRVLDVGCGTTSLLAAFNRHPARRHCRLIGLDAHAPTIDWCRVHGFHDEYVLSDARDHDRLPAVDVVVATDLVEHFDKAAAVDLIAQFERKAAVAVLLFTPNGYVFNPFTPDNPYMEHKCGFTVDDFTALRYECIGMGGPKGLRGPHSLPRGPRLLYLPLLAILSRGMRGLPRQSFHLLARKAFGRS